MPGLVTFGVLKPGKATREGLKERFNVKLPYKKRFWHSVSLERDLNSKVFFSHFEGGLVAWVVLRRFQAVTMKAGELLSLKFTNKQAKVCIGKLIY